MTPDSRRAAELRAKYVADAIETAPASGRLTMLLDALELDLARADKAFAEKADLKTISDLLIHAQDIIAVLRDTLDTSAWEPATQLQAVYQHLYMELVRANVEKDRELCAAVARQLSPIASAWREAALLAEQPASPVSLTA